MPDQLTETFAALADPTRRAIIDRLSKGAATVSDVAEPFLAEMSLPAVTKHLKVLERAGLISKSVDAQRRICQLNPEGFKASLQFLDQYRQLWEESLDRLDVYIQSVMAERKKSASKKKKKASHGRQKRSK